MTWRSNFETLPRHQRDGIRFLMKKLKKKARGAILNDPSGYGKRLQVIQFLVAIQSLINKPVLILCPDKHMVQNWLGQFHKWTTLSDYISVETSNIFAASKKIFINELENVRALSRRQWSVLIINEDFFPKELLGNTLKADFKIWVTSEDMKTSLNTFYIIYNWMNPNTKWDINDIITKSSKPTDTLAQNIKVDYFLEENVLRRKNFLVPFEVTKRAVPTIIEVPTKSKKNKDASGTKIKRSRKRSLDNNTNGPGCSAEVNSNTRGIESRNTENIQVQNESISSGDNMDINRDTKAITNRVVFRQVDDGANEQTSNNTSALVGTESEEEMLFSEAIRDVVENENSANDSDKIKSALTTSDKEILIFNEDLSQSVKDNDHEIPEENEIVNIRNIKNNSNNKAKDVATPADVTDFTIKDSSTVSLQTIETASDEVHVTKSETAAVETQDSSEKSQVHLENTAKKSSEDQLNLQNGPAKHKLDDNDALSEFEQSLLKKFKGSYLDRLF